MKGLGVRQRRMIARMRLYGHDRWPQHWGMRAEDSHVHASLQGKGLVGDSGILTCEGQELAANLVASMSDATRRQEDIVNEIRGRQ